MSKMRREEIEHIETYSSLTNHIEDLQKLKEDGTFDALAEKYGLSDMTCLE